MTVVSREWQEIARESVPARPSNGIWTAIIDYVTGPVILKITSSGEWQPVDDLQACSADGLRHWAFGRDSLLTKKAPLGALIGKLGGSNIATDEADIFLVGTATVVTIDRPAGPLYLTINDAPSFFDDNSGELQVLVEQAV